MSKEIMYKPQPSAFVTIPNESAKLRWLVGLTSLSLGVIAGYFRSHGIKVTDNTYKLLIYSPAVVQGSLGAVFGGISGALGGKQIAKENIKRLKGLEKVIAETKEIIMGATVEGSAKSVLGIVSGGAETLVGYTIGSLVGHFY